MFADILRGEGFSVEVSNTLDVLLDTQALMQNDLIIPVWTMGDYNDQCRSVCAAVESRKRACGLSRRYVRRVPQQHGMAVYDRVTGVAHPVTTGRTIPSILKSTASPITEGIGDFAVKSEQYYIHVDRRSASLQRRRFLLLTAARAER